MHPILDALDNTQHDWIKKLLFTFNEGNIGKFEALAPLFPQEVRCVRACCMRGGVLQRRAALTPEQPLLEENYPFLRQKICLMALIESVFKRNSNDRTMSFQTIAEETRLPLDEVEHLVMKALRFVADWLLTGHVADNQSCCQPQVDTGFAGPGRSESTHYMGPAACAVTRSDR